jgi:hypothetical protein
VARPHNHLLESGTFLGVAASVGTASSHSPDINSSPVLSSLDLPPFIQYLRSRIQPFTDQPTQNHLPALLKKPDTISPNGIYTALTITRSGHHCAHAKMSWTQDSIINLAACITAGVVGVIVIWQGHKHLERERARKSPALQSMLVEYPLTDDM